jgi:hypothetical protein
LTGVLVTRTVTLPTGQQLTSQAIAWQISTADANDLLTAATIIGPGPDGYPGQVTWTPDPDNPANLIWQIVLTRPGYEVQDGGDDDWIVWDTQFAVILSTAELAAEGWSGDMPLVWDAGTVAPVATALPGAQASLVFEQPTSANGPFTYTVTQTDTTAASGPTAADIVSGPTVDDEGNVTLIVGGLVVDDVFVFVVDVTTPYEDASGVSATTTPIMAVT